MAQFSPSKSPAAKKVDLAPPGVASPNSSRTAGKTPISSSRTEQVCDTFRVAKVAASLPGFASVARASEVLHLAPRSVRGLIYAGRLPSVRLGRLHYIRAADLELERRRRLGLPPPTRSSARPHRSAPRPRRPQVKRSDPEVRRQRASERVELVKQWAQHHDGFEPHVPATVREVESTVTCEACHRQIRRGRYVEFTAEEVLSLCTACARRALMEWADRRRLEAAAARRLSESLGQPEPAPVVQPRLLVA